MKLQNQLLESKKLGVSSEGDPLPAGCTVQSLMESHAKDADAKYEGSGLAEIEQHLKKKWFSRQVGLFTCDSSLFSALLLRFFSELLEV